MTKALLSRRGIEFVARDIENNPGALDELRALGASTVPVVAIGERYVIGWNPSRLADLVGFTLVETVTPPRDLIDSIDMLLVAALRAVRQIPDEHLMMRSA